MSPPLPPPSAPVESVYEDPELDEEEGRPELTPQVFESLDAPASSRSEAAWADEIAEQVIALWEGRPGLIPFDQILATTQARSAARRR
jgi:hypothetical protein